jgi:TonB-dependent starch-binding outer membrane protein SusC
MQKKKLTTILFVFLISTFGFSQEEYTLKGVVVSKEDSFPLPGVKITISGSGNGTSTGFIGEYQLKVRPNDLLTFSYSGKRNVSVVITNQKELNISLQENVSAVSEIVVIGYGTKRKSSLTGAVAKLENKNLEELPYSNTSDAIKGKIAGVQIRNTNNDVGEAPRINIRGSNSISLSSSPLIVVDGFPYDDALQHINPATIKSIEVLKDASSAAIYGSRGSNGVIIITTKDGADGKTKFEFKQFTAFKSAARALDILDVYESSDIRLFQKQTSENLKAIAENRPSVPQNYELVDIGKREIANNIGGPTDWQQEAIRSTALIKNYNFVVSGGNVKTKYFLSTQYINDEGLLKNNNLERFNFQSKFNTKINDNILVGVDIRPSYTLTNIVAFDFSQSARYDSWIPVRHNAYTSGLTGKAIGDYASARDFTNLNFNYIDAVTGNVLNTGNLLALNPSITLNPSAVQNETSNRSGDYRAITNAFLELKLGKYFKLRSSVGAYFELFKREFFQKRAATIANNNTSEDASRLRIKYIAENTLTYNLRSKSHKLEALVGTAYENEKFKDNNIRAQNFSIENTTTLNNAGVIDLANTYTLKFSTLLLSALSRVSYDYDNRYLLTVAGRYDGFSKFGKENKFGFFPSASIGWNIGNEKFWKNNIKFISRFKLRSSYGITGNNNIAVEDYPAKDLLLNSNYSLGGNLAPGYGVTGADLGNNKISWETSIEYDHGLELGFFNNKLNIIADYYNKISQDLILKRPVSLISGSDNNFDNIGKVQNIGYEFDVSLNLDKNQLKWQASANLAFNKNKLVSYGGSNQVISTGERQEQYLARVGDPYIQFYGYKTNGVWQNQAEINAAINPENITTFEVPGGIKRVDLNGDRKIDANDKTVLGNPFPDFIYGFTNNFNYKNLDLNFSVQGSQGGDLVFGDIFYREVREGLRTYVENSWFDPAVTTTTRPKPFTGAPLIETDYAIQDASYVSLREVILGYKLPTNFTTKMKMDKVRVFISAQNLLYYAASGYYGLNPEASRNSGSVNPLISGYQRGSSPVQKQFVIGFDLNF